MKMPIVSLNNMAMNESVAATCCFAATDINGHAYETVLSGGYLSDQIGNDITYKVGESWLTIRGDYAAAHAGYDLIYTYDDDDRWLMGINHSTGFVELGDLDAVADGNLALYQNNLTNCDHLGSYCSYVDSIDASITKVHVGSTVQHSAGGTKWASTHTAVRFNS